MMSIARIPVKDMEFHKTRQRWETMPTNMIDYNTVVLPETVRIPGLIDVNEAADLTRGERNVLVTDHDLQLLKKEIFIMYMSR